MPPTSPSGAQSPHQHPQRHQQQHHHPHGHYHLRHAGLMHATCTRRRSLLLLPLSVLAAASLWIGHIQHQHAGSLPQQQVLNSSPSSSSGSNASAAGAARPLAAGGKHALAGLLGRGSSSRSSTAPAAPQQQPEAAGIPRIIHQNYMAGEAQLLADALKPLSHFRKEWWGSCKTHHPAHRYMFWDEAGCEALLRQRYAWFLPTWRALSNSTVLKSDAIRPFILHAYGGVYLDLDVECFTDVRPWLAGADVVLQAEVSHTLNNAQMASVPGHPLWTQFQRAIQARVAAGKRWALDATGPHVLTHVVRKLVANPRADLPGRYDLADGSRLVVFGAKQFYTPCSWNDWGCAVELARNRPCMSAAGRAAAVTAAARAATKAAAAAATAAAANATATGVLQQRAGTLTPPAAMAAAAASAAAARRASLPFMLNVQAVAGVHHFSGSWLGLDGSKSLSLRREGESGAVAFLFNGSGFVEQPCQQLRLLPPTTAGARGGGALPVPVCWEDITAAAAAHACTMLSVRPQCSASEQQQFGAESALARAGCQVTVVTPRSTDLTASNITTLQAVLSVAPDPFAEPPALTLDGLLTAAGLGGSRVTLLVLDDTCGSSGGSSSSGMLDVLNALHVSSSPALASVDAAALLLPAWQQQRQPGAPHKAFAAYQHLCQERGLAGFFHSAAAARQGAGKGVALGLRRPRLLA